MVNPLLFPPALVKRALDDLHAIGGIARRFDAFERALLSRLDGLAGQVEQLREELLPIQEISAVRAGIEPLDDDLRQVRESIDEIEPLVKEIGSLLGGLDDKLAEMSGDLAPVGDLAEKMPGVKRR